ncbi:MAG: peroxiredoxin [Streptosporangiaceae bacterium]
MPAEVGETAPDFELADEDGAPVRLSDFRGHENVVLVFYPFAFTGVCGRELREIQADLSSFASEAVRVRTVSVDWVFSHRVFAEQEGLEFPLLADFWPHGAIAGAYGVFDEELGAATRGTFIIDRSGVVRWKVVNPVPDARDTSEYREALAKLT